MRYFNTEGICKPKVHYMVRLDDRLQEIRRLYIDQGKYFVINRGRQYGKTTTLTALADFLSDAYAVLPMNRLFRKSLSHTLSSWLCRGTI